MEEGDKAALERAHSLGYVRRLEVHEDSAAAAWVIHPDHVSKLRLRLNVSNPELVLTVRNHIPVADRTCFELILDLEAQGFIWEQLPKDKAKRKALPPFSLDTPDGSRRWYSAGPKLSHVYLRCLLDASDILRTLGPRNLLGIEHCEGEVYYTALLQRRMPPGRSHLALTNDDEEDLRDRGHAAPAAAAAAANAHVPLPAAVAGLVPDPGGCIGSDVEDLEAPAFDLEGALDDMINDDGSDIDYSPVLSPSFASDADNPDTPCASSAAGEPPEEHEPAILGAADAGAIVAAEVQVLVPVPAPPAPEPDLAPRLLRGDVCFYVCACLYPES